ncbi:MAG: hypothetical protein R2764_15885 [Bacteroidales bacterium]
MIGRDFLHYYALLKKLPKKGFQKEKEEKKHLANLKLLSEKAIEFIELDDQNWQLFQFIGKK